MEIAKYAKLGVFSLAVLATLIAVSSFAFFHMKLMLALKREIGSRFWSPTWGNTFEQAIASCLGIDVTLGSNMP